MRILARMVFVTYALACAPVTAQAVTPILPSSVSGLLIWADVNSATQSGGVITAWSDSYTHAAYTVGSASVSVTADSAIRGRQVAVFYGDLADTIYTPAQSALGTGDHTWLVCAYPFQNTTMVYYAWNDGGVDCRSFASTDTAVYSWGTCDRTGLTSFGDLGGSTYQVMVTQFSSGVINRWTNNVAKTSALADGSINLSAPQTISIGSWGGVLRAATGRMSELLVYNRALSTDEIAGLTEYMLNGPGIDPVPYNPYKPLQLRPSLSRGARLLGMLFRTPPLLAAIPDWHVQKRVATLSAERQRTRYAQTKTLDLARTPVAEVKPKVGASMTPTASPSVSPSPTRTLTPNPSRAVLSR